MKRALLSSTDVMETAGDWVIRSRSGGLSSREQARLEIWLAADVAHRNAFDAVQSVEDALESHADDDALASLRAEALKAPRDMSWPLRAMAACLIGVVLIAGATLWALDRMPGGGEMDQVRSAEFATGPGERAMVTLADGSTMTLNTDSAVETRFDQHARTVRLLKGQALFTVAHDPGRPFDVLAGERQVTAVGTVFDVLLLPEIVRVGMIDGVVRVSSATSAPLVLSKGEVLTANADGALSIRQADVLLMAGWRDGVIYFDDTPLADALEEMNRYARDPVSVADQRVAALRVSGAFRVSQADSFAQSMTDLFPLVLSRSESGRMLLIARGV